VYDGSVNRSAPSPCIYCRVANGDTDDHVPPKGIFPEPRPSTLITVPACDPCNAGFQKDDEVFTLFLSSLINTNQAGRSIWEQKVESGLLKRSAKLKRAIGSTLRYRPLRLADGRRVSAPTIMIESDRLLRVFRRIVRGLAWHEYRACDFPDASVEVLSAAGVLALASDGRQQYEVSTTRVVAHGVFEYDHATRSGSVNDSIGRLEFYKTAQFHVIVKPELAPIS
jgi:hypothetical protein